MPRARGFLKDTRPVSIDASWVSIGVDSEFYDEDLQNIDLSHFKEILQTVLTHKFGRDLGVRFERLDEIPPPSESLQEGEQKGGKTPREWCEDPIVKKTLQMFDGEIRELRV